MIRQEIVISGSLLRNITSSAIIVSPRQGNKRHKASPNIEDVSNDPMYIIPLVSRFFNAFVIFKRRVGAYSLHLYVLNRKSDPDISPRRPISGSKA